jgi:hypothetical protein
MKMTTDRLLLAGPYTGKIISLQPARAELYQRTALLLYSHAASLRLYCRDRNVRVGILYTQIL